MCIRDRPVALRLERGKNGDFVRVGGKAEKVPKRLKRFFLHGEIVLCPRGDGGHAVKRGIVCQGRCLLYTSRLDQDMPEVEGILQDGGVVAGNGRAGISFIDVIYPINLTC